jgi:electron transfer flavoprotein alpha subunit
LGEIEVLDNSSVNADSAKCGLNGSPTKVLKTFENSSGMRNCKFISPSEFKALFDELLKKERSEIKFPKSTVKMKSVWAIGDEVSEKAYEIAENVEIINEKDPYKIAEMAREKKPSVILWNADLWGRKNAPIVSALLKTGLCADCTHLETDGEKLYMYRPAKSGNIIAKIECKTYPQMATVRCKQKSDDIVVSGGRGVYECFEKVENFAKEIKAELCASRSLVDKNVVPYEMQVGLTGKTISPKIYIATGISGAAQHTCAIEDADTVIAVNPDKDAPIFKFADYGIVCGFEEFYNLF